MFTLPDSPRFALIGAGAIGCYYGGRLAQHGQEVHFLLRSDFEHVRRHGLHIESCAGDFDLPASALHVHREPGEMPKVDVVLVTLKTTANRHFETLIRPLLHEHTCILTLQNGLGNEQELARLFGGQRILGGLAFTCINRIAPGHIRHSDYGLIKIGELDRPPTPRLRQLSDRFNHSLVPCKILDDLRLGRWEKLIWNVPFNGYGAALGLSTERMVNNPAGLALVRSIMEEVVATAHAAGVMVDHALIEQNIQKTLTMGPYKSSMQIDREMGRPIELEMIIAEPIRVARQHGVGVPKMEMLYQLLATQLRGPDDCRIG